MTDSPNWVFHCDDKPTEQDLMAHLVAEFPTFRPRWEKHVRYWNGEPAGAYNDISEFAHFIVEDLYPAARTEEVRQLLTSWKSSLLLELQSFKSWW